MNVSRRSIIGALPLLAVRAHAQSDADWPKRPIHVIVSAAPGSAGDDVVRLVLARISDRFHQQFVIDNRPAAGGTLAEQDLSRSAPDGYTIGLLSTSTHVIAKFFDPDLPYDPVKDFAPISMLGSSPYVLAVYPGLPVKTVAELVALAKSKQQPAAEQCGIRNDKPWLSRQPAVCAKSGNHPQSNSVSLLRTGGDRRGGGACRHAIQHAAAGRAADPRGQVARACDHGSAARFRRFPTCRRWRVRAFGFRCGALARHGRAGGHAAGHRREAHSEMNAILTTPDMREAMMQESFVAEPSSPAALAGRISADLEKWREHRCRRARCGPSKHVLRWRNAAAPATCASH